MGGARRRAYAIDGGITKHTLYRRQKIKRTLYGGWVEVVARGGNDHDGGDGYGGDGGDNYGGCGGVWRVAGGGDRGGEEGDNDEVLVWCTRSSDGDGGVAAIAGI
ncbi:hypothetical protein Tco_0183465 [Tanacetum coccineum]